jgi:hypothetical protein
VSRLTESLLHGVTTQKKKKLTHSGRLLRHLGAMGYITETGADEYQPNNFTKSLSIDIIGDAYIAL